MRIVFFSHYYPPEVNAPASRTSEHARIWARAGHDVVVITCAPNHPGGKLYPGYANRLRQTETIDGVRILRVWTFLAPNEGFGGGSDKRVRSLLDSDWPLRVLSHRQTGHA